MIGQGRESNGLYLLDSTKQQRSSTLTAATSSSSCTDLWHTKLGHPSFSKLQLLKSVVNIDVSNKTPCCDVCHFSKQKRLPFSISAHVSSAPFELIHCDLWGPFSTCTIEGYKYIKTTRSDNGTEFYLKEFFHSDDILH